MAVTAREPRLDSPDPAAQLAAYLDYYRASIERKLDGLDDRALNASRLPSGWTPLELLAHLVHMEQRWFVWGFLAEDVAEPWGDHAGGADGGRWAVPADAGRARRAVHRGRSGAEPAVDRVPRPAGVRPARRPSGHRARAPRRGHRGVGGQRPWNSVS